MGWDSGAGEAQPYFALPAAQQTPSSPGGRSGAMIAIAAILSVLLAVLLAAFLTMLCR